MKAMFAEIDGVKTPRPKGQDEPVKAFGKMAPTTRIAQTEPTDRFVLWFISNYKYAFNVFFTSDFAQWMKPPDGDISKWQLSKYLVVVKSLSDRHLIEYADNQRLTYKITLKGQIYRTTSHPAFPFITLMGVIATLGVFFFNRIYPPTQSPTILIIKDTPTLKPQNSNDSNNLHTVVLKDSGSSLIDNGKTKTKGIDTTEIKQHIIKTTKRQ